MPFNLLKILNFILKNKKNCNSRVFYSTLFDDQLLLNCLSGQF